MVLLFNYSLNYSVLSAITGSFFAAEREGMMPAIRVKNMLIATRINPAATGSTALILSRPVKC